MAINIKYRFIIAIPLLGLLLLMTACPSESFCDLDAPLINRSDDIIITPDQNIFNINDSLKVKISIPSAVSDNQNSYNIRKSLEVNSSERSVNLSELLFENTVITSKGRLDEFQAILEYSQETDSFEFECIIVFKRQGKYIQIGNNVIITFVKNAKECEFIDVVTTIERINEDGFYEFTVEE